MIKFKNDANWLHYSLNYQPGQSRIFNEISPWAGQIRRAKIENMRQKINFGRKWFLFYLAISLIVIGLLMMVKKPTWPSPQVADNQPKTVAETFFKQNSPEPTPFTHYTPPKLPKKDAYGVFLVGDSMTVALGPHPSRLSSRLNEAYPDASFVIDNYGISSLNIFSLPDLLTQEHNFDGRIEPAALNRDFDILIIESFANNPLSDLPLSEGLQKQREVMDLTVQRLLREKPNAVIILLATVAPSNLFGKGVLDLPLDLRRNYANERRAYLENFIGYALEKGFPLVDAYYPTRQPNGDAKPGFINPDDYIHPSQMGVDYLQDAIADLIIDQRIIP